MANFAAENGDLDLGQLRRERDMLRQALAETEAERDGYRHLLYAYLRATITDEEKAELERRTLEMIRDGGIPFRDVLNELIES